jgi:general nucleoside transport system ATP-binding protein
MFAVEMYNIEKHFGSCTANDDVTLRVVKGEIHALVGENGAGKSTLMNLLYGIDQPSAGEIRIDGHPVTLSTPAKAIKLGIGMVHQHFMLIPPLTVAENIILGSEPTSLPGVLDIAKANRAIQQLSDSFHFNINPKDTVGSLSVGEQQRVEILKLLYRNAEIIILDEPTAILTPQEVEELFQILRKLKQENKTIIFISHKVAEILLITDRVTVMRKGKVVGNFETASTNPAELARTMVGREVGGTMEKFHESQQVPLLRIERLCCENSKKLPALRNVSFAISSGEILGVAAVEGNGQSELIEVLTGLRNCTSGEISIGGRSVSQHRDEIPLAHIPEDRLKYGLVLDFTLEENFILGRQREPIYSSWSGLNRTKMKQDAVRYIQQYHIYALTEMSRAKELSGGNQQKVVIARELSKNANVIIACHPTRGLDVGATEFVHNALLQERNQGKAVLLVSSDLSELLTLSDRVAVLFSGEIVKVVNANETSERELGLYMTGASRKKDISIN